MDAISNNDFLLNRKSEQTLRVIKIKQIRLGPDMTVLYTLSVGRRMVYRLMVCLYISGALSQADFINDLRCHRIEAERIFNILVRNAVTPSSLFESADAIFDMTE